LAYFSPFWKSDRCVLKNRHVHFDNPDENHFKTVQACHYWEVRAVRAGVNTNEVAKQSEKSGGLHVPAVKAGGLTTVRRLPVLE
jgi:hypothetical protein